MEGPGGTKEDVVPLARLHPVQQVTCEYRCAAPAARASAVDVLLFQIKDQCAAVGVVWHLNSVPAQQLQQQLAAQGAQIPGDDKVVAAGGAPGVLKVGGNGVIGGGG